MLSFGTAECFTHMVQLDHLHTCSNRDLPRSVVRRANIVITKPDRRVFQRVDNHRVSIGILTQLDQ